MTKIFLIRHAEAEGNIYRRAHGHYNGLVTLKGEKQIELLSRRFDVEQVDAVYSSDLSRTVTTAAAISRPRNMQIITMHQLREVDMGSWEDRTWGDIEYYFPEMNNLFGNDPANWVIDGGEPYEDVQKRMYNCLLSIAGQHDGGTVAVFSHGFAIRSFLCMILGVPSQESYRVPYCDNTAVTLICCDNNKFTIDYAGDNLHLTGGSSTLEKQSWWKAEEKRKPENLRFLPLGDAAPAALIDNFRVKAGNRASCDVQYAAFLGDEPVAILGLDSHRDAGDGIGWINFVFVLPHHRKSGLGTQLIGTAVSDFRKLRRDRLRIALPAGSPDIVFFKKCGFFVLPESGALLQMEKDITNRLEL